MLPSVSESYNLIGYRASRTQTDDPVDSMPGSVCRLSLPLISRSVVFRCGRSDNRLGRNGIFAHQYPGLGKIKHKRRVECHRYRLSGQAGCQGCTAAGPMQGSTEGKQMFFFLLFGSTSVLPVKPAFRSLQTIHHPGWVCVRFRRKRN